MGKIIGTILGALVIWIFGPTLAFLEGWLMGWFTNLIIGDWVVEGLSYININITNGNLPMLFGAIAAIACFFTSGIKNLLSKTNED
ncbi:MAG: hypothetical protein IKN65_06835 [Clostridia bacterium]|nr:hypothetical protein [Clostridia bacterium]